VPGTAAYLSPAERLERGKAARRQVPRAAHAAFEPAPGRPDPVDLLQRQASERVSALVPIRYGRMLATPFTFYRGAALIMASDLAGTPTTGFQVQCCGDAHLSNFGLYASPERRLVFDINDFDETLPGPWEWDVKRLAASMLIAARNSEFRPGVQERIVLETVRAYRTRMRQFATMRNADVWYTHFEIERLLPRLRARISREMRRKLDRLVAKAVTRDSLQAYSKLAVVVDGEERIVSRPPLIVRLDDLADAAERHRLRDHLEQLLAEYGTTLPHHSRAFLRQFRLADVARKVVGVGSVGTEAWIALLLGRDGADPLFLQFKQAQASVLEGFVAPSAYRNAGERVVAGQRIMQASSDILLGWLHVPDSVSRRPTDYYVRQLRDWKGSVVVENMDDDAMTVYGRLCADTLAHAHARSGDRVAIAGYLGGGDAFDRALLAFAVAYAEQNERDFAALGEAARSGRIEARSGI
jgi:uncharacterized protein (DUF2252 family)